MNAFRHLLVATDLSSSSLHAVDRGFLIAAGAGARYTVLHALGLAALDQLREWLAVDITDVSSRISNEVRDSLTRIISNPQKNHGVQADLRVEPGLAATVLPAIAATTNADLLLLGAHGKGFLQRFLLGSTASRLLRASRQPVLVVKEPCRGPYRRVLIAIDFSPASGKALEVARLLAPGAEIILLHVFEVPFEGNLRVAGVSDDVIHRYRVAARDKALHQLQSLAQGAGLAGADYGLRVLHGDATRQLLGEEENSDCDLIVMGKHGTNVAGEFLLGSVTNRVLAESRSDVLVVTDERMPDIENLPA